MSPSAPIVAAMSGGVDSSVMAATLVEAGHRVVGMTMRLYNARGTLASSGGRCCGPRDIEDARRVCAHLGIPFYVVDFESDFERDVVDQFVDAYLAGETPNPCVKCNQHIKFTPLLRRARALGASAVATGHYARLDHLPDGDIALRRGLDEAKDQSYFLFSMPPEELASVRFPLGDVTKDLVRERARGFGLPVADKPDSQEICFVPDGDYAGFVSRVALARGRRLPPPGDIVDLDGELVGQHRGIHHYTVGQRRGLGNLATDSAVYVVDVDAERDRIVVGPANQTTHQVIRVRDLRWLSPAPVKMLSAAVQVRHRAAPVTADICVDGTTATVQFEASAPVAAPGQAAVFYRGDRVLGGGWIAR